MTFLESTLFIPHGHCYLWKPELVGLHILADGLIALAYYSIPLTLSVVLVLIVLQALASFSSAQLEAANQSLSRLAAIVESSGDAIIGKSLEGVITSWNASAERLFGYTATEAIGQPIAILFPLDHADELSQVLEQIKQGETIESYETMRVRKGGQRIDIAATISPIKDAAGRVIGAAKIARDISSRKQAEAALQESEARFQSIVTNMAGMIYRYFPGEDGSGKFTYVSLGAYTLLELEPDQILQDANSVWTLIHPGDLLSLQASVAIAVQNCAHWHWEGQLTTPSGQLKWIQGNSRPQTTSDGLVWDGLLIDISDRKQAEEALRESDHRFRAIFNTMFQFMGLLTPEGILLEANQAALEFAELMPEDVVGRPFWEIRWWTISAATQAQLQAAIAQAATGQFIRYEVDVLGAGDTVITIDFSLKPIRDETGQVMLLIPEGRDISDRKQTEAALRYSEATNRAIINAIPDFLFQLNRDGNYLHLINTNHVVGLCVRDMVPGVNIYDVLPFDKAQERMGYVERALDTRELQIYDYEFVVEGEVCYEEARISPISEQEVLVMVRDITDRRRAELMIELQSIMVSNMAEGVCMVKVRDGLFVYTNPKFERMFGYETDELVGQHVAIVNYEDKNTHTTALYEKLAKVILAQGEAIYEVHNVRKDGTSFWCQATTSVFEHPNYGAVFVVVQQDITERKQAESMIQASLKEKEVLLKEIHHRVKNNLGVVDGLLQMQARRSPDPQVVETLKESQNRIASIALVHEKLYGSKDLASIDFAQYIADLTAHLFDSYNTHSNQIKLITQLDDMPLDIDIAIPCGLIINELVSNALKYAFPNAQGEIHVTFHQHEDQFISLTVRDNGIGLPPGFNLKQTKTLGMSLIQGLAKQIKGTLEISSDLGTTVILKFAKGK